MSGNSATQDARSEQAAEQRRRKRKERAAQARAPEPKDIVSGAGQPLDVGVRRELEDQLGHDLGRVRLHTGRDAGQLTELLGADAVAVGQDVFFREGAYRPGTADGQRLLAHELLHTVQNPDGLGALRAGRDLGAVSLPQQAIEREAESAAQDLVRPAAAQSAREPASEVAPGQATPGWLRYATVDADRNRLEQIDPATLVDRLTNSLVRSLRGDPEDRSKRTRHQLARLSAELLDGVLDRLEGRLLGSEHDRVLDLVEEIEADGDLPEEPDSYETPAVEADAAGELRFRRESERRSAEEEQTEEEGPGEAPGPEKEPSGTEGATGSTPENGGAEPGGGRDTGRQQPSPEAARSRGAQQPGERTTAGSAEQGGVEKGGAEKKEAKEDRAPAGDQSGKSGGAQKENREDKGGADERGTPAASEEESAAKNRPGAVDALVAGQHPKAADKAGQPEPTGSPTVAGKDTQLPARLSRLDGVRNQDLEGPEETADEEPFGSGSESEVEVGGEEKSAWDIKLQPEDFIPEHDPDVSGIPTADASDPSSGAVAAVPSFPAPPVTRADKVQAERDAEDAEDAAAESEAESESEDVTELADTNAAEAGAGLESGPGDSRFGGLAVERAAAPPSVSGVPARDPKSGADPKAGPVAAQTAVQQAPGRSEGGAESGGEVREAAAKEEKGTPAGGEKSGGAQEKASLQASPASAAGAGAGSAAVTGPQASSTSAAAGSSGSSAGSSMSVSESGAASPARDSHVSGNTSGSGGGTGTTESPAAQTPAPATPQSMNAPQATPQATSQATSQSAPESAPEPVQTVAAPASRSTSARSAPAAKGSRGGGGGGGGGSAAVPAARGKGGKKDSAPAPNLSQVSPEAGLSTASNLKPHRALEAMGGVGGSVDRTVGDEHKALAAAPPSMQRPAGAPQTLQGKPKADAPAQYSQDPAQKSEAPEEEKAEVKGAKEPEGQIEAEKAEEPGGWDTFKMALGFGIGWIADKLGFEVDAQELAAKFAGLPTKDEALKQAQAGNAPGVELQGAAEGAADEQGAAVDTKGQETVTTGRDDAARPMGENQVYPDAPKEQLKAKVPGAEGGKGGAPEGGASTGAVPPEAASEVAEHDRGPQFKAAFSDGQKGMSDGRQTKDRDFRDSQAKHKQKVDAEVAANTESQAGEREKALGDVTAQRADWRKEQDEELKNLGTKKTERHDKVRKDVQDKEKKTDDDVAKEKDDGDKKIQDANTKAEQDAEKKRDDSVNESGNWISKAFDWLKEKIIEIKNAIVRVIRAARDAVVGFIRNFKATVERWINEARKFIVDAIKNLIDDLIEFAKALVRGIIELAARIRKFISDLISAAIALVNRLAKMLKQIVTDLLNAIGKLLGSILSILRKMLLDVVKAVVAAVKTVLEYASKLLSALGEFMMIAVDFLSDPGGWLSGAKNSAVDGAKNHLFREVQAAVKQWFQSKIEEIIGIPRAMIDKLIKGGFTLERIVKETWDAIVPQLPFIIGEIVITKVIAKLIPGAGWAMAVIDAIRTAIGALSEILRAIGAVITWLRAVRQGGAGVLFAKAVAAGIVALLELAYEALLSGIGKYVAKVGRRLKGVAANLGREKPRGGDGKTPAGQDADDRGDTGRPRPTTAASPPTARPRPGAAPVPKKPSGTAATPSRPTTSAPKKPTPTGPAKPPAPGPARDATRPGPAAPTKPVGKDKNGRPKNPEDEKPDTRPTPSPKPKPQPAPRPRPKPEPDTGPRSRTDTPGRPKDDHGPTTPKPDTRTPDRPKDQDSDATRPTDKDGTQDGTVSGKPRTDKPGPDRPKSDKDGSKPDRSEGGDARKPKHGKDDVGRPRGGKEGPSRPRGTDKQDKRRRRNEEEESPAAKKARLELIAARIREILRERLDRGITFSSHKALLGSLRRHYKLSSLYKEGGEKFTVVARLNPSVPVIPGFSTYETEIDHSKPDPPLPTPRAPSKKNNVLATDFTAEAINESWANKRGEKADKARKDEPIGFRYINKYDLNADSSNFWVRQHLLTQLLGGTADGRNLVPARNRVNQEFKNEVEIPAEQWIRAGKNKIAWYDVKVNYHSGEPRGFPSFLRTEWGAYYPDYANNKWEREKWPRDYNEKSGGGLELPPGPGSVVYVNYDSALRMQNMLNIPKGIAEDIEDVADVHSRNIPSMSILLEDLKTLRKIKRRRRKGWDGNIRKLIRAAAEGHLTFDKKQ
ncbi:hypothetical protein QFZ75_006158 [Streptomyces sp. V3I8]|uniref:eCIS core domain-containing protein n=1 Tax=Streptomyces sp. V3I8 TaxID=3042279 RepID=UPI002785342F|nr:DUF4157 domain-containing protein [Streptomyces sp. V3I8]MDQ1039742.1 hypothetical protein [Streptomyces sp. V3I8]